MDSALKTTFEQIDQDRDHVAALTQDLDRIPSVNSKFQAEDALNRESDVQDRLAAELGLLGFSMDRWDALPGRPNLTADLPWSQKKSMIHRFVDEEPPRLPLLRRLFLRAGKHG